MTADWATAAESRRELADLIEGLTAKPSAMKSFP